MIISLKKYIGFCFLIMLFISCEQPRVYERTVSFSQQQWQSSYKPWITIEVPDSNALYDIYAVIRHNDAFAYDNLKLNYSFISPGDTVKTEQINLPLGNNKKWFGDTLGEVIEARIKINTKPVKLLQGNNIFILQELMPGDQLENILNAGIKIDKVSQQ